VQGTLQTFKCAKCGEELSMFVKGSLPTTHSEAIERAKCDGRLEQQFSKAAPQFNGSGWTPKHF
jgi:predicted nucleic acid-binding Zn ribbon protein